MLVLRHFPPLCLGNLYFHHAFLEISLLHDLQRPSRYHDIIPVTLRCGMTCRLFTS